MDNNPVKTINFDKIQEIITNIITDQAKKASDPNATLSSMELSKAATAAVINSLSSAIIAQEQIDFLEENENRFKRKDELRLFNSLRRQVEKQTNIGNLRLDILEHRMNLIAKDYHDAFINTDDEINTSNPAPQIMEMEALQDMINNSIKQTANSVKTIDKLVRLERISGGRRLGNSTEKESSSHYITSLDKASNNSNDLPTNEIHELSEEEAQKLFLEN